MALIADRWRAVDRLNIRLQRAEQQRGGAGDGRKETVPANAGVAWESGNAAHHTRGIRQSLE